MSRSVTTKRLDYEASAGWTTYGTALGDKAYEESFSSFSNNPCCIVWHCHQFEPGRELEGRFG
jgi:hypothetical protein